MVKLKKLLKSRVKKDTNLWEVLAIANRALHILFKNKMAEIKINTFLNNLKPNQELRVIFGGHWYDIDGWLVLHKDEQNIKKPLKFPDQCVDVIFNEHVIEHVDFNDAVLFMQESKRILKNDGVFRVVCPMIEKLKSVDLNCENGKIYIQNHLARVWHDENTLLNKLKVKGIYESPETFLLNSVFTKHEHKFIWSETLMIKVLKAIGFSKVSIRNIGEGINQEYCLERRQRGLYLGKDFEIDRSTNHVYDPESKVVEAIK